MKEKKEYVWKFRPSSSPVCSRFIFFLKAYEGNPIITAEDAFVSDCYFEFGKAAHLVVQKWLGKTGLLYGDWICQKCKSITSNCLRPVSCLKCACSEFTYKELDFAAGTPFSSAHPDGFLLVEELSTKEARCFSVLEIKTISQEGFAGLTAQKPEHRIQAGIYALLGLQKGIRVVGVLFLYMNRNKPSQLKTFYQFVDPKILITELKAFKVGQEAISTGKTPLGICRSEKDGIYCQFRNICFSPSFQEKVREAEASLKARQSL